MGYVTSLEHFVTQEVRNLDMCEEQNVYENFKCNLRILMTICVTLIIFQNSTKIPVNGILYVKRHVQTLTYLKNGRK